jgi:microcystin-dependent protein
MACGCQNTCGCIIVGDGVTAEVAQGPGAGTFTVSSIQTIMGVEDTDCIALAIDGSKILRATPILSTDPGAIELECTEDGLAATLIVDPASTAIVSTSVDGLRVDVPPPPAPSGDTGQPGDYLFYSGIASRPFYIDADGSEVDRTDYEELWNALSLVAISATRDAADTFIYGLVTTRFAEIGMQVEADGFPPGMTIVGIPDSTTIEVSSPALSSGSDTVVRVYPHGNGDGATTFNVPDMSGRFPLGFDYSVPTYELGEQGGAAAVTLNMTQIPEHNHGAGTLAVGTGISGAGNLGVTISGSTGDGGQHRHAPEPSGDTQLFVTVNSATDTTVAFANNSPDDITIPVDTDGATTYAQRTRGLTDQEPDHTHPAGTLAGSILASTIATSLTAVSSITGGTTGNAGGLAGVTQAHENRPPYTVGRWMVHV